MPNNNKTTKAITKEKEKTKEKAKEKERTLVKEKERARGRTTEKERKVHISRAAGSNSFDTQRVQVGQKGARSVLATHPPRVPASPAGTRSVLNTRLKRHH